MSPIREEFVTLAEVDELIRKFEEKYSISTIEFLRNAELRASIPEDDVFQWEAFEAHRNELLRTGEELRSAYLSTVAKSPEESYDPPAAEKQSLLAA